METLSVADNELTSIKGITACNKLKTLILDRTKLEAFDDVPDLPGLEEISMVGTPLAKLEEVGKLISFRKLRSLNLSETPLAEEKGDDLKKEVLILLDGLDI